MSSSRKRVRRSNLPEEPLLDLCEEILYLRSTIRRVYDLVEGGGELELEPLCKALSALGVASTRLARLLAAQRELAGAGGQSELTAAIYAVLAKDEETDYPAQYPLF